MGTSIIFIISSSLNKDLSIDDFLFFSLLWFQQGHWNQELKLLKRFTNKFHKYWYLFPHCSSLLVFLLWFHFPLRRTQNKLSRINKPNIFFLNKQILKNNHFKIVLLVYMYAFNYSAKRQLFIFFNIPELYRWWAYTQLCKGDFAVNHCAREWLFRPI